MITTLKKKLTGVILIKHCILVEPQKLESRPVSMAEAMVEVSVAYTTFWPDLALVITSLDNLVYAK